MLQPETAPTVTFNEILQKHGLGELSQIILPMMFIVGFGRVDIVRCHL